MSLGQLRSIRAAQRTKLQWFVALVSRSFSTCYVAVPVLGLVTLKSVPSFLAACFALSGRGSDPCKIFSKMTSYSVQPVGGTGWRERRKRKGEGRKFLLPFSPCPRVTSWSQFVQVSPGFSAESPASQETLQFWEIQNG